MGGNILTWPWFPQRRIPADRLWEIAPEIRHGYRENATDRLTSGNTPIYANTPLA